MKKIISVCLSATLLSSFVSSNIETNSKAATYRTEYTVYGDVNGDKVIDTFDVVEMRGRLVAGADYNSLLDLNHDEAVDEADLQLLQDYILGRIAIFDAYYYDDADTDGICDLFEIGFFETNPDSEDTDGDTLSDYDEIVYTKTLPTTKYTNGLSVTDAEDDTDSDKLTNAEEIKYGTLAFLEDSDDDDISDYDEINTYLTDPNDEDSDDDYIFDGDELAINLNPNNPSTDGVVQDSEYIISQNIAASSVALSTINNEDNSYELSIDTNSAGVAEKSISVSVSQYSGAFNENITGKAVDISYNKNLKVENIKLNFALKEDEFIDNTAEDFMIFEYFPDKNYLLPVETKYDGNTVYVESPRVGTYCLVNTQETFNNKVSDNYTTTASMSLSDIVSSSNKATATTDSMVLDYELGEIEVSFSVDISGCLDENLEETKKSIHDSCQAIFEHSDNATVAIIGYYYNISNSEQRIQVYADSNKYNLFRTIESVDEALDTITPYTTNKNSFLDGAIYGLDALIENGLHSSDCENKYSFIISDSSFSFTNSSFGYNSVGVLPTTCETLEAIYNEGVQVNFLLSSANYNRTSAVKNLRAECEKYDFGIYSKSQLGNFATAAFSKIYSDAIVDLTTIPAAYTCSVTPNSIPDMVNRNAFIYSLNGIDTSIVPEADADGNINYKDAAVDMGLADYDVNGNLEFENYRDACESDEITLKGYEQLMSELRTSTRLILESVQITPFSEKIMFEDNDGDGLANKDDPYPDEPFDDRFEIVSDYSHEPTIDFVEKRYQNSQSCHDSLIDTIPFAGTAACIVFAIARDDTTLPKLLEKTVCDYPIDFGLNPERENNSQVISRACDAMRHYFSRSGNEVVYSESDTCELISSSVANLMHLFDNLNNTMRCAEKIVMDGNSIIISPKSDQKFKATCFTGTKDDEENTDIVECNINTDNTGLKTHALSEYCNYVHRDWQITVGEATGTIVAEIERNGDTFKMKYRYYFKDIYEWAYHYDKDPGDISAILHGAHESGDAQEYLMQGYYEGYLSWTLNDKITDKTIAQQIFMTLAEKEDGIGSNPSEKWTKSNEIERFKQFLSIGV